MHTYRIDYTFNATGKQYAQYFNNMRDENHAHEHFMRKYGSCCSVQKVTFVC